MSQNETMYISEEATCPMASCSRSNTCARHAGYQKALAEKATFSVLNPQLLKLDGNNCPYHLVAEKQLWARGFKRMYDTMPSGNTHFISPTARPMPSVNTTRQRRARYSSTPRCKRSYSPYSSATVPTQASDSTAMRSEWCWWRNKHRARAESGCQRFAPKYAPKMLVSLKNSLFIL